MFDVSVNNINKLENMTKYSYRVKFSDTNHTSICAGCPKETSDKWECFLGTVCGAIIGVIHSHSHTVTQKKTQQTDFMDTTEQKDMVIKL